ncbi:thiol-disulfide oxidoreductase ResA [Paenibacillus montaniterrae]|uniref:Thiol-disulfide oxidoreductase ResA n=1 Tax=Paenibacillus montaniterrae TaxID=429341 RepID=A0A919YN68_9BACL|nr:redoxin domain-containing protein [Paenibacillus montaniterrae]GIP15181.1 thiol-disulfide oxidoreductase ResA [Paenibacillus montaniterrae]
MGKNRKKVQVVVLLLALLLGGYAIVQSFTSNDSGLVKEGQQVPEFRLANLQGEPVALEDYVGKPVVINFWGTFCEPCIREMPSFERQHEQWKDQGVEILAINLSEDTLTVSNYVKKLGVTYTILRDVNRKTEKRYGIRSYPTTFFVNRDGTLSSVFVGEMKESQIEERISKIVQQ